MQTIYRQPNERLLKSPISQSQENAADKNDDSVDSKERNLVAPPHRVIITPTGNVVGVDYIRNMEISLQAECALKELKAEEAERELTAFGKSPYQRRILVDKLGTIREL